MLWFAFSHIFFLFARAAFLRSRVARQAAEALGKVQAQGDDAEEEIDSRYHVHFGAGRLGMVGNATRLIAGLVILLEALGPCTSFAGYSLFFSSIKMYF